MGVEVIGVSTMSATYIARHNVHSSWIDHPEFILLTHCETGVKTGRLYIPAVYLDQYKERFVNWLQLPHINYDESDLKLYDDGSIRLYFRSTDSEYARCAKYFPKTTRNVYSKAA